MRTLLAHLISLYQLILSPVYRPCCRFYPTCSEYARQAVLLHGAFRGSLLAVKRIARCHPLCAGGVDPVPEPGTAQSTSIRSGEPNDG